MQLIIDTPKGALSPIECDSVHLTVCDDSNGKNGGSYGIRKGHIKALIALEQGNVTALLNNETVFSAENGKGFATVENDVVTLVIEEYKQNT